MNMQQARQTPVGMTDGQFKALTSGWKYSPQEISGLIKETASELLDACSRAGHKLDGEDYAAFKEAEALQDRSAIEKRGFLAPVIIDRSLDRLFSDLSARAKEDEFELRQELKQVNKTMSHAAEWLGRVLTAYKDTLPYKKWLPFLELIGITPRSAQRYMELASIKKDLGPSMTQALEDKGIHLTTAASKAGTENKKIAALAVQRAKIRLQEKQLSTTYEGNVIDDAFEPTLTEAEQAGILEEAINEVRPPEEEHPDLTVTPEQRIAMWEASLVEALKGLYFALGDKLRFRQVVIEKTNAIMEATLCCQKSA